MSNRFTSIHWIKIDKVEEQINHKKSFEKKTVHTQINARNSQIDGIQSDEQFRIELKEQTTKSKLNLSIQFYVLK